MYIPQWPSGCKLPKTLCSSFRYPLLNFIKPPSMSIRIDLRSDTVTKPSAAMREAIAYADVGDDVIGCDPTVDALQNLTAELLAKRRLCTCPADR